MFSIIIFLIYFLLYMAFVLLLSSLMTPIPINDTGSVRYDSVPWMTLTIIAVNTGLYFFWQRGPEFTYDYLRFFDHLDTYASRRELIVNQTGIGAFSTITGIFMHIGIFHLTSNMIFLWAFGRRVEDACGPWRFLLFYMLAGVVAKMAYYFIVTETGRSSVGASGAISGVMGAYMVLFPGARIGCLWVGLAVPRGVLIIFLRFLGIKRFKFRWLVYVPSVFVLIFYMGQDVFATLESASSHEMAGGVNYVAHAGGFLSGVSIPLFVRKDLLVRYFSGRKL
jgi:membrane associated rhomboid family serine protease